MYFMQIRRASQLFRVALVVCILHAACAGQAPPSQQSAQKEPPSHVMDFFQKATNGAIFIYGPQVDPCVPTPKDRTLLPLGSAFVAGIDKKGATAAQVWTGWKFLVTAKHVVAGQRKIIVRINAESAAKFVCKAIELQTTGQAANVVFGPDGVDLAAVALPDIPGADPTIVTSSLLVDAAKMKEWRLLTPA